MAVLPTDKEILEAELVRFESEITKIHQELHITHEKKEYTFSTEEKRRLAQLQTIIIFAQNALDDILNLTCLPRIGVIAKPEVRLVYDISLGRYTIWLPKKPKTENPAL